MLDDKKTLVTYGIQHGSTIHMFLSSTSMMSAGLGWAGNFLTSCKPMCGQTIAGLCAFNAVLYVVVSYSFTMHCNIHCGHWKTIDLFRQELFLNITIDRF